MEMIRRILPVSLIVVLLAVALGATPARAAGVVTDCTEIGLANAMNAGGGLITFDCGPNPVVIPMTLQNGGLNVISGRADTIDGGDKVTLDGEGAQRLFDVRVGGALTLTHIILKNGYADLLGNLPDWGGAILDEGNLLVLDHVTIRDSHSLHLGGAVRVVTGTALIQNSLIENNQSGDGGGIDSLGALTVTNTILRGNQALNHNGGGLNLGGPTVISNTQILSNTANGSGQFYGGGGVAIAAGAPVSISDSQIQANHASTATISFGGGLLSFGALTIERTSLSGNVGVYGAGLFISNTATLNDSVLSANAATLQGGGLELYLGQATLNNTTLSANTAARGGGLENQSGVLSLNNVTVSANVASDQGGGLNNQGGATLYHVTFGANRAGSLGGAIYTDVDSPVTLTDSTLNANSAGNGGGGLFSQGVAVITRSTLSGNAAQVGGGIFNSGVAALYASTLSANSAGNGGGLDNVNEVTLFNSTLSGNTAAMQGGGLYNTNQATAVNVTLANNSAAAGGALFVTFGRTTVLTNTVLAYSPAGGNCGGTLSAAAFTLSSDNSCALAGLVNGHNPNGLDPLLTPLGNYGGPTLVHMLKLGSPAIGGVLGNNAPNTDQRGQPRPGPDGSFDIGAVERQPADSDPALHLFLPLLVR